MTEVQSKKTILSASTTTGVLTLGNYIGAIRNWKQLQKDYECFYMVADLHSLTVKQNPEELRERIRGFYASYLACGLDPKRNTIFIQSHVPEHAQLQWVLNCITPMGALNRMTQFKEKSARTQEINAGLFNYPVLMAADILLYQAHLVPVGEDQKQHLELTRDLAQSFNSKYGEAFIVPDPYIAKVGARIMSLQDPASKMSKSDPDPKSYVSVFDPLKKIQKKIKGAVTDSDPNAVIRYDRDSKPGLANLMTIYSVLTGESFESIEAKYEGKMYGHLKVGLADIVCEIFEPIQQERQKLLDDSAHLDQVIQSHADKASERAQKTLDKVYKLLGLR